MKKILLVLTIGLMTAPAAYAVPHLQLFIDGATYDWDTQTWVLASTGSVDLYVISANEEHYNVWVSMALYESGRDDDPTGIVTVEGFDYDPSDWTWGYAPVDLADTIWEGGNEDLPRHGVFPTWYAEVNTGDYDLNENYVGDVQPPEGMQTPPWDPSDPFNGDHPADGDFKLFSLSIDAPIGTALHFDAYTLLDGIILDRDIDEFAPFSHDATTTIVPEPGTILLMSTGLLSLGLSAIRRRKR